MSEKRSCCCGALPKLWWWLLTLLGLPLLFWLMISSRQNLVETDLTARTTDGLKAASLNDVQVNLDHRGRDAQLTGKVASDAEREQAVKLVQDTQGIRVVDNAIEVVAPVAAAVTTTTAPAEVAAAPVAPAPAEPVAAPAAAPTAEPSLALMPQDGKWLLQGSLSSQAEIDQALAAAEGMYGAGNVVNQLTVGQVAPATWLSSLGGLKEALSGIEQSGLKFANGAFALMGVASSDQAKAATAAKVQQLLGGAKLEDQLTVKAPEVPTAAPSFALLPQDGKWILQGTLNSQAEIDQAMAAAEQMYGAGNIVNQLTVGQVAPAAWLASLGGLKEVLTGLGQAGIKFANGAFALMGTAGSDQAKADALAKAQQLLGTAVEDQVTVKAAEPAAPTATAEVAPAVAETPAPQAAATPEPAQPITAATEPAAPAPVPLTTEQQSCQDHFNTTMNGHQILFETNKAIIKRDSLKLLDDIAKIASDCKSVLDGKMIRVGGHTDNVGEDAYNLTLSQQRADAVKDYLAKQGLDSGSLAGVGYGETQPIASNDTEAGRAQNRRISFDIIQK